jgi:hypothetical protein
MNTGQLIDLLSASVEPVKRRQMARTLAGAVAIGSVAALCVMLATVSLRPDLTTGTALAFTTLKFVFAAGVIAVGLRVLSRLVRPGRAVRLRVVLIPFLAIAIAAIVALAWWPSTVWPRMIVGPGWRTCLYCIPLFAVAPFALLIWALRKGAPTNLVATGAIAGLVAGAIGGAAYAFHCADDALPFIAVWYGVSIALCALVGASLGARLLRW